MAAEVLTIPRVYLRPEHLRQSMYHTAHAPAPTQPNAQPGTDQALVQLVFVAGVAYDVPTTLYDLFAAQGIATKERPLSRWERADAAAARA